MSIGPGSFTGLRVGLATVLGFHRAGDIDHFGPDAGGHGLEPARWAGVLVPVLKSRHNEVYWGLRVAPGHRVADSDDRTGQAPPASVARACKGVDAVTLFGNGWQAYERDIRQAVATTGAQKYGRLRRSVSVLRLSTSASREIASGDGYCER